MPPADVFATRNALRLIYLLLSAQSTRATTWRWSRWCPQASVQITDSENVSKFVLYLICDFRPSIKTARSSVEKTERLGSAIFVGLGIVGSASESAFPTRYLRLFHFRRATYYYMVFWQSCNVFFASALDISQAWERRQIIHQSAHSDLWSETVTVSLSYTRHPPRDQQVHFNPFIFVLVHCGVHTPGPHLHSSGGGMRTVC